MTDGCEARGWPLSQSPCPFSLEGDQTWITVARAPLPSSLPLSRASYRTANKGWLYSASLDTCTRSLVWPGTPGTESGSGKVLPSMFT